MIEMIKRFWAWVRGERSTTALDDYREKRIRKRVRSLLRKWPEISPFVIVQAEARAAREHIFLKKPFGDSVHNAMKWAALHDGTRKTASVPLRSWEPPEVA